MLGFPAEILDSVIDQAHEKPSTLAACSLVCRQWVPRTRYYTFSSIHLVDSNNANNITKFITLLESPHATFISSVREVTLFLQSSGPADGILTLLIRHGVAPTFLHLHCQMYYLPRSGPLPSLTHLRLDLGTGHSSGHVQAADFRALTDFIHGLTGLTSLALDMPSLSESITRASAPPPSLRELEISRPAVLANILSFSMPGAMILPHLILRFIDAPRWEKVVPYLNAACARNVLESLTLIYCNPLPILKSYPTLRHLTIGLPFHIMASHVLAALADADADGSPELETLTLNGTRDRHPIHLIGPGWLEVDSILSTPSRFPRLRSIILCGGGRDRGSIDSSIQALYAQLPSCAARGFVVLQYTSTQFPRPGWV
ncbi:hypothetical protein FB45DRAFT_932946 [Roridomyces roridus]|uniref:Uncharacterized protein n=1 Tax=Roridomyces roridus TaxID=1738132 RepID=A0AAD7BDM7_9AGAR|nr:hypothetical protein FB45DRAFT_932946 [Roridomyces roridus]